MKILTVIGKTDSRAMVYPLARALSISGLTGIITDDGAYRRLFPGKGNIGCVNNIDIGVVNHVTEETMHVLDHTGIDYDYKIVVSSDYIPEETDGIIVAHGVDRSILEIDEIEDGDSDFEFIIAQVEKAKEAKEGSGDSKDSKDSKKFKKKGKVEEPVDSAESDELKEDESTEDSTPANEEKEETEHEKLIRLQEENPDKILIDGDTKYSEVQIAYVAAPKKGIPGIQLKDGLCSYVYNCEDQKRISVLQDKGVTGIIAKLVSDTLGIDKNEMMTLLYKEEGQGAPVKAKK